MSLTKLVARLRAHELSPREAVEGYLERIDARRDLNAYITVRAEEALAEADDAPRPPLHGAPIAVKDVIDVAGTRMTAASAAAAIAGLARSNSGGTTPSRSPSTPPEMSLLVPAIASNRRAQSSALRAIGPMVSNVGATGKSPPLGTTPVLGRSPVTPQKAAGMRIDPPVSVPSVPCGFVDGLPTGLALVGRPHEEATVLRAGHAYQQATDWHERQPA